MKKKIGQVTKKKSFYFLFSQKKIVHWAQYLLKIIFLKTKIPDQFLLKISFLFGVFCDFFIFFTKIVHWVHYLLKITFMKTKIPDQFLVNF